MSKKKKKCKDCKPTAAPYYTQGKLSKKDRKWICEMLKEGIPVYHQYGTVNPDPPPPPK